MRRAVLALALACCAGSSHAFAESLRFCDREAPASARQQDRLLQFAAVVKGALDESGARVALVARSGQNLRRFGVRYTHAGVSLKAGAGAPWSVRQLYFACDERRPRLFDQGLAGFLFGIDERDLGYLSVVLLPPGEADALERAALDRPLALALVAPRYSANAYAWSLRYQNCNQWVMELLAAAWGAEAQPAGDARAAAQRWLAQHGYAPRPVEVGSHLWMAAAAFVPWLRLDDHPQDDRFALHFRTSMPASIEAFVRDRVAAVRRIEFCHDGARAVIRRDGAPIADGCVPEPGDRVVAFD